MPTFDIETKKKNTALFAVLAATALLMGGIGLAMPNAFAAAKQVEYTFTVADLGQGVWGGGSLYEDGSASGNVAFSAGNGQFIFQIRPVSWELVDDEFVDICFEAKEIKGEAFFPPEFCLSDEGLVLPITGQPVTDDRFLIRVTPVGN